MITFLKNLLEETVNDISSYTEDGILGYFILGFFTVVCILGLPLILLGWGVSLAASGIRVALAEKRTRDFDAWYAELVKHGDPRSIPGMIQYFDFGDGSVGVKGSIRVKKEKP